MDENQQPVRVSFDKFLAHLSLNGYALDCLYVLAESPECVRLAEIVHVHTCTHVLLDMAKVVMLLDMPEHIMVAGLVRVPSGVIRQHEEADSAARRRSGAGAPNVAPMDMLRQTSVMAQTLFLPTNVRHAAYLGRLVEALNGTVGDSDQYVSMFAKSPLSLALALPVEAATGTTLVPARFLLDWDGTAPAGMADGRAAADALGGISVGVFVNLDVFYNSVLQFGALASRIVAEVTQAVLERAESHMALLLEHAQKMAKFCEGFNRNGVQVLRALASSRQQLIDRHRELATGQQSGETELSRLDTMQRIESVSVRLCSLGGLLTELVALAPLNPQAPVLAGEFEALAGKKIL